MNPLQEHPNLFANGNFKVRHEVNGVSVLPWDIVGMTSEKCLVLDDGQEFRAGVDSVECTLIARPIEDMTDEEHDMWTRKRYSGSEGLFESPCSFNYLLSIGCLPKIWEYCFDDGTVIDSREVMK